MNDIISVPKKKYVFFDEDGAITAISNSTKNKTHQFIEVNKSDVEDILDGSQSVDSFCVIFDTLDKTHKLMHKNINKRNWVSIISSIFEIEPQQQEDYDIAIIQNNEEFYWEFILSPKIKMSMNAASAENGGWVNFSCTRKGDPHELYQMLRVRLVDLVTEDSVKIPYYSNNKFDISDISVYTMKKFERYHYEVIDEQQV
jgi:hypothetical protein